MIYINRDGKEPDSAWMEKADLLTLQLLSEPSREGRNFIIDKNVNVWRELKDFLLQLSNNKCWYSEAKDAYSHLHVDHFRPKKVAIDLDGKDKGGYWWLAFEWTNYRVTGNAGNVRKKDKFAVRSNKCTDPYASSVDDEIFFFLDPCEEEDILKLTFNGNGEIKPIYPSGLDYERATYTIKSLYLNFKLLKEARKKVWIKCATLVSEAQALMADMDVMPSAQKRGQIKEKIKQLRALVNPMSAFSATARACLQSVGLPWALQIAT